MCRRSGSAESGSGTNESTEDRWDVTLLRISSATLVGSFEMAPTGEDSQSDSIVFCGLGRVVLSLVKNYVYFSDGLRGRVSLKTT